MEPSSRRERRALAGLALGIALAAGAAAQDTGGKPGAASLEIGAEELSARIGIPLGASSGFGFRIDADSEAAEARAFLELGSGVGGRPVLAAGPGAPAGAARFILDPASPATLSPGPPIAIDRSMGSGRAAMALGSGRLFAFAIGEAEEPLVSARFPGLRDEGGEAVTAGRAEALAAGLVLYGPGARGGWSVLVDASSREPEGGGEGWSPDPPPERGGTILHAAFVARRKGDGGEAGVAIAASAGRLDGSALAARVQARGEAGPISLNVSIGAAGPGYRGLFGEFPAAAFLSRIEAKLRLRRSSSVSLIREDRAEREGRLSAPAWGSSDSIEASIAIKEGLSCALSGKLRREPPDAQAGSGAPAIPSGELSLSVSRRAGGSGTTRSKLGASVGWKGGEAGARLGLDASFARDNGESWPSIELGLKADFPGAGDAASAPSVRGSLEIAFPLGPTRELSLDLALPSGGLALAPTAKEGTAPSVEVSIVYRASLPPR
jgi:hypothetical protein